MASAAVFLDRDNTLIHNDGDLGDPAQVEIIQGVPSAIASLRGLGYRIIVVTNQGGVARGKYGEEDVEAVHQRINELIQTNSGSRIDRFYYCPYHPDGVVDKYKREHPWRKPSPGMLLQAARDMDIDLSKSWMIGDQMRDVEAGRAAGVRTVLLTPDAPHMTPLKFDEVQAAASDHEAGPMRPTFAARSLIEATRIIAQQRKPELDEAQDKPANKRWNPAAVLGTRPAKHQPRSPQPPEESAAQEPPQRPAPMPVEPKPQPQPVGHGRPFRPWNAPSQDADAAVPTPPDDLPPPAVPIESPAPSPEPPPRPAGSGDINLLRQILHELRAQRGSDSDFAFTRMIAVVLQMIVVLCFVGAFWMSGEDGVLYLRWTTSAILIQMATIAMLLFSRR
jgi:D-glycero-D-manno-heptose 1,7-bisphosphate phosphatase